MENNLYSVKVKFKNKEEYLIGFNNLFEAHGFMVRLEEDDRIQETQLITK